MAVSEVCPVKGIGMKNERRKDWSLCWQKVQDEAACRNCGTPDNLDPAHTIPRSQGGGMAYDSVIPLCRACHDAQHSGSLELLPLLTEAEEMEAVRAARPQFGGSGIARAYRMLGGTFVNVTHTARGGLTTTRIQVELDPAYAEAITDLHDSLFVGHDSTLAKALRVIAKEYHLDGQQTFEEEV